MSRSTQHQLVIDFSDDCEVRRWLAVDDIVMGGVSSSRIVSSSEGTARFSGELSLEQGGGFASIRSQAATRDLATSVMLTVRVRGDGQRYQLRLRTTNNFDGVSYAANFDTSKNTWQEHTFLTTDFQPTWRGQIVENAATLALKDVQGFGVMITDKQAGNFDLEIAWIAAS